MFLAIEAALSLLALALAFAVPKLGSRWFEAFERSFGKLAQRRGLSVVVVGLTALALRLALLPILPIPQPGGMDGFSYLLLADTFAHGRVANPTNPMWVHFESFHIIWQPSYVSKFYPAQGLIMALGQVLLGHPFWGVWLSAGIMCAAITWMLQACVGEGWALLGGFLAVIRLGSFSYWADSYWGGAVAAIGGALVLGALPRLKQEHRLRNALLMGLGFAILGNSRPYEGIFFGIPVAGALLVWVWKLKRPELGHVLKRAVVPLVSVLALTLVAMGYYFWRTTGSPFNTPYLIYEHTYNPVPYFPWQNLRPIPHYHFKMFRELYLKILSLPHYELGRSIFGIALMKSVHSLRFWQFFLGPVFTLPLVMVWLTLPVGFSFKDIRSGTRFLMLVCGLTLLGDALPVFFLPHYAAPITCAILALVLIALRQIRSWQWRCKPTGLFVARAVPSICVLLFVLRVNAGIAHWPPVTTWPGRHIAPTWCSLSPQNIGRAATLEKLRKYPGRQLVIVHYGPKHDLLYHEWVYNRADLNSAKVIWARDMGPAKNQELVNYFRGRHAWEVFADENPPKLVPYSENADGHPPATTTKGLKAGLKTLH